MATPELSMISSDGRILGWHESEPPGSPGRFRSRGWEPRPGGNGL